MTTQSIHAKSFGSPDVPLTQESMLEEYRFLRRELEANRSLVFERPLLIVGATLGAAVTLADKGGMDLLPVMFLSVLTFNLWFTHNRLKSNTRIIGYLQVVHEGSPKEEWRGWENSLRAYRKWVFRNRDKVRRLIIKSQEVREYDSMGYYAPIYYFHLTLGIAVTSGLLYHAGFFDDLRQQFTAHRVFWIILWGLTLSLFSLALIKFRPTKAAFGIRRDRILWKHVLHRESIPGKSRRLV